MFDDNFLEPLSFPAGGRGAAAKVASKVVWLPPIITFGGSRRQLLCAG
jgi:hypothetical protein